MRSRQIPTQRLFVLLAAFGLLAGLALAGCGGSSSDSASDNTTPDSNEVANNPGSTAGDQEQGQSSGQPGSGGTATLEIGDKSYEFAGVQCAFGTDETKNSDWDFSLSAIKDGTQLSVSRGAQGGQYGDSITYDDFQNTDNPTVAWSAPAHVLPSAENPNAEVDQSFVEIDGKSISAQADFDDSTEGSTGESVPGTLTATCP
jgi:hypothetical protein